MSMSHTLLAALVLTVACVLLILRALRVSRPGPLSVPPETQDHAEVNADARGLILSGLTTYSDLGVLTTMRHLKKLTLVGHYQWPLDIASVGLLPRLRSLHIASDSCYCEVNGITEVRNGCRSLEALWLEGVHLAEARAEAEAGGETGTSWGSLRKVIIECTSASYAKATIAFFKDLETLSVRRVNAVNALDFSLFQMLRDHPAWDGCISIDNSQLTMSPQDVRDACLLAGNRLRMLQLSFFNVQEVLLGGSTEEWIGLLRNLVELDCTQLPPPEAMALLPALRKLRLYQCHFKITDADRTLRAANECPGRVNMLNVCIATDAYTANEVQMQVVDCLRVDVQAYKPREVYTV
jgi:hypothetical protein